MKLKEIYEFFVEEAKKVDPRGRTEIAKVLEKRAEAYKELKEDDKLGFDRDSLWNPYSDSKILNGTGNEEIKSIMVGIDIEAPELLIAQKLKEKGKKIDLVMSHHPEGRALATLYSVMDLQQDVLQNYGVPINVAEALMQERIAEVERNISPINHTRTVDAAKLLEIPLMCAHTVADNHVQKHMLELFDEKNPETLADLLKLLRDIPEYKESIKQGAGPKIFVGKEKNRCGKIVVDMTGGTEGHEKNYEALGKAGIGTIVAMHTSDKMRKKAEESHVNIVIAGHMSSDNVGVNLLLDKLEKKQKMNIVECSGFKRVRR